MARCERHEGRCAYDGSENDRCLCCHSLWTAILACGCESCGRSRDHHLAVHASRDARRLKGNARRQESREKAASGCSGGPPGRFGGSPGVPGYPQDSQARTDAL